MSFSPFLARVEGVLLLGSIVSYFAAMILLWTHLFFRVDEPAVEGAQRQTRISMLALGRALLWAGAGLHLLALLGESGVLFSERAGVASLFGWVLVVAYLTVAQRLAGASLGAFVTPWALLAALYPLTVPRLHGAAPPALLSTPWIVVHVAITLLGYVALAFAFGASSIYLLQESLLKRKRLTGLWQRLPSLLAADEWIYRTTLFGLSMLTLGIFTGVVWQRMKYPDYAVLQDPKVLLSLATWLTFVLYLAARWWLGWSGRRSSMVVVCGFVLLVISFLGTPHLLPGVRQ
jgi:ABC-type uncharacterized transport system permease subunit